MRGLRLAALAGVLAAVLLSPAPAGAARGMEVALQDDQVLVQRVYYDRDRALDQALDLRVSRIRVNVRWATAAARGSKRRTPPRPVLYDFRRWDDLVTAAHARGVEVQMALTGDAPRWATGRRKKIGNHKPRAGYFRQFAKAAALHFKGRVDRYSIWNEPNHVGWIKPKRAQASTYRQLFKRGYAAIKRVDPGADVLFGETAPYASKPSRATPPLRFLRQVLCVNRSYRPLNRRCRLRADGYAHHPYDYLHPPTYRYPGRDNVTMSGLDKLTKALDRLAKRRMFLTSESKRLDVYLTEFGYFARGKYRLGPRKRAKYLVKAFDMAQRNPRVRQMLQYLLVRPSAVHAFFDTSIVGRTGRLSRPYRKLRSWAAKAGAAGRIALPQPPPPAPPPGDPPPPGEPGPVPPPPEPVPPPPGCDPLLDIICPTL